MPKKMPTGMVIKLGAAALFDVCVGGGQTRRCVRAIFTLEATSHNFCFPGEGEDLISVSTYDDIPYHPTVPHPVSLYDMP